MNTTLHHWLCLGLRRSLIAALMITGVDTLSAETHKIELGTEVILDATRWVLSNGTGSSLGREEVLPAADPEGGKYLDDAPCLNMAHGGCLANMLEAQGFESGISAFRFHFSPRYQATYNFIVTLEFSNGTHSETRTITANIDDMLYGDDPIEQTAEFTDLNIEGNISIKISIETGSSSASNVLMWDMEWDDFTGDIDTGGEPPLPESAWHGDAPFLADLTDGDSLIDGAFFSIPSLDLANMEVGQTQSLDGRKMLIGDWIWVEFGSNTVIERMTSGYRIVMPEGESLNVMTDYLPGAWVVRLNSIILRHDVGEVAFDEGELTDATCGLHCWVAPVTQTISPKSVGPENTSVGFTTLRPTNLYGIAVGAPSSVTGLRTISVDTPSEAEYYDLNGRRVTPASHGIYLCKRGQDVIKVVL